MKILWKLVFDPDWGIRGERRIEEFFFTTPLDSTSTRNFLEGAGMTPNPNANNGDWKWEKFRLEN